MPRYRDAEIPTYRVAEKARYRQTRVAKRCHENCHEHCPKKLSRKLSRKLTRKLSRKCHENGTTKIACESAIGVAAKIFAPNSRQIRVTRRKKTRCVFAVEIPPQTGIEKPSGTHKGAPYKAGTAPGLPKRVKVHNHFRSSQIDRVRAIVVLMYVRRCNSSLTTLGSTVKSSRPTIRPETYSRKKITPKKQKSEKQNSSQLRSAAGSL